jgi:hypothetical protein
MFTSIDSGELVRLHYFTPAFGTLTGIISESRGFFSGESGESGSASFRKRRTSAERLRLILETTWNEKPYAETCVRIMQRQWATPVPNAADLAALNALFRMRCLDEVNRTVVGQRFAQDRAAVFHVPSRGVAAKAAWK